MKERNVGMSLLRIWMCYEVIMNHFYKNQMTGGEWYFWPVQILNMCLVLAAPVFMLISFSLSDMEKMVSDKEKIKGRFYRLLVPHLFWSMVYFLIFLALDVIFHSGFLNGVTDLFWQLLLGHSINQTLWFQIDLIWLTALFCVIFSFLKNKGPYIACTGLFILAMILQYTGINGHMFDGVQWPATVWGGYFDPFYVTYPIGRVMEVLPIAVIGIFLHRFRILERLKKHGLAVSIVMVVFFAATIPLLKMPAPDGYGYSGISTILQIIFLMVGFYTFPFEKLPNGLKNVIHGIAKYTMAIYFMHRLTATLLYKTGLSNILHMHPGSLWDCGIIFLLSLLSAWLIGKIPVKWVRASVM